MSQENHDPLILVVEDEPKLAQLMIDYLHASNYRTHHIADGNAVLEYVRQTPPDLMPVSYTHLTLPTICSV